MKCRSDSSGGGDDLRDPGPAAMGVGGSHSGEPSKKQRTEEPSPTSSSVAGECSSSSSQAPPPALAEQLPEDARVGEQPPPPPGSEAGGAEQVRVPDLGEDLVFEVLMRSEARTLAAAACVSRGWRQLARDERLWEAACVRDWAYTGFSEHMLRTVVLSLGGFRRLHEMYIRPVLQRAAGAPPPGRQRQQLPVRMGRDQVQVSLSLLSTSFFLKMPNAPPPPPKDKDKDRDKNGGGQCG